MPPGICRDCGLPLPQQGTPKLVCLAAGCTRRDARALHALCFLRRSIRQGAPLRCRGCGKLLEVPAPWRRRERREGGAEGQRLLLADAVAFARLQTVSVFWAGGSLCLALALGALCVLTPEERPQLLHLWQRGGAVLLLAAVFHAWRTAELREKLPSPGYCLYFAPVDVACFWAPAFLTPSAEPAGLEAWLRGVVCVAGLAAASALLLFRFLATAYLLASEGWGDLATICACLYGLESRRELRKLRREAARDQRSLTAARSAVTEAAVLGGAAEKVNARIALEACLAAAAASAARLAAAESARRRNLSVPYVDRALVEAALGERW